MASAHHSVVFLELPHWIMQMRQFANLKRLAERDAARAEEPFMGVGSTAHAIGVGHAIHE